jgi:hypothetical protein
VLSRNEAAIVEGELVRGHDPEAAGEGYRDNSVGWVLRPRDGFVHISTEDLGRRHSLRARAFAIALLVQPLLAAVALLPTLTAHARVFAGHDETATYEQRTSWTTRNNKGRVTQHYGVRFVLEGTEHTETIEIDRQDYYAVPEVRGASESGPQMIWVRRVPSMSIATSVGQGPTVNGWLYALAVLMAAGVAYWVWQRHSYRRWYERTLVERASGHLPKPSGRTFNDPS